MLQLPLDRTTTDLVALSAGGVAVLALLLVLVALIRLRRLRRRLTAALDDASARPIGDVGSTDGRELRELRELLARTQARVDAIGADVADALRHVAVVRYDAFQDMGGRMSFSAAMLDDAGDGIVLTAINGRSETRAYAKGVHAGGSDHTLSPEEQQAIDHALRGAGAPVPARRAG